jgi:CHAD domain-containing protein
VSVGEVQQAKVEVALGYEQRADAAAAAVLRRLLEVVADNIDGALAGADVEYLHQLRIAVRRSRTVQRQFRGVFPGVELPGLRSDFRWLQRATGESRDLDVYVEEFDALCALVPEPARRDLAPLRLVLTRRQLVARLGLAATLRSARFAALADDWERMLESLVELPLDDRPTARRSIGSLTGERVVAVYERIVVLGRRIDDSSPADSYHALRKKGKELRYLLELFGAQLFEADVVEPLVRSLKAMQDLLGRHQDREVQVTMLRGLADEVATLPGGPRACLAMGVLVDRLGADEHAARAAFAERFAVLADDAQRERVTRTFR